MSYFTIKIFAIIFMLIDHVGLFLLDGNATFRLLGRIAFPLFCFLLVNGYYHTSDEIKYLKRLALFAIVSEICHDIVFYGQLEFNNQNVFFTLTLGLLSIIAAENCTELIKEKLNGGVQIIANIISKLIILLSFIVMGYLMRVEYGWYGILLIYALYLTYGATNKHKVLMVLAIIVVNYINILLENGVFQAYSIMSVAYIYMFREQQVDVPKAAKMFCYIFYPAHLLVLGLIKMLFLG